MHRLFYCLCLLFACVRSQNINKIENLLDSFVYNEEKLWKIINYYKNDATRTEDVKKVLQFYEIYMDIDFGEIGIFQMISKEWLNDIAASDLIKHIATVNSTFAQAFKLVKTKSYADILKYVNELPRMIESQYSRFLLGRMAEHFWSLVQNVKNKVQLLSSFKFLKFYETSEKASVMMLHYLKSSPNSWNA